MSGARHAGWLLVAALLAQAAPLHAQDPQRTYGVATRVDACVPIDRTRFDNLLAIELGEAVVPREAAGAVATIALSCANGEIEVRLEDRVTRKSMIRRVEIQGIEASARTRLMALTVAEFVLASWLEVRLFREEQLPPAGPAPPPALERRAAAAVDARLGTGQPRLGAALETVAFPSAFQLIPCFGLRFSYVTAASLAFRAGLQLGHGMVDGDLAGRPVDVRATLASLLATVLYTAPLGPFEIEAGVGARIGFVSLEGRQSRDPALESARDFAPWGGPLATVSFGYPIADHAMLSVAFEAGYIAARTRAVGPDGMSVVAELKDMWTGAALAFDWLL